MRDRTKRGLALYAAIVLGVFVFGVIIVVSIATDNDHYGRYNYVGPFLGVAAISVAIATAVALALYAFDVGRN